MSAYPLKWPQGWPRTPRHQIADSKFGKMATVSAGSHYNYKTKAELTVADALRMLYAELNRLGARDEVVSTNIEPTLSGTPRSGRKAPEDSGVAVYFTLKGKERVLACDKWRRVAENIAAIAKHVDALRGQERWGVGSIEQAFTGYTALPAPNALPAWWEVLQCREDAPLETIYAQYKRLAFACHPDRPGGNAERMTQLNGALEQARKAKGI